MMIGSSFRRFVTHMGLASGLAIALSLSVGLPAQASGGEHGELSDSELTSIALAGDPGALEGLSAADLKRLIKLSALDTSKTATALTIQVPPRGAIPNGEQIEAIEQAVGGGDITFAREPSGAMNASQFATMASGCYLGSYSRYGKNAVGANLYRYWIEIRFCMSGSTVTSTQILSTGGETYWLGWSYDRLVGKWSAIISNQGRNYSQHHFRYSILQVGTIQNVYPCIQLHGVGLSSYGNPIVHVGGSCALT